MKKMKWLIIELIITLIIIAVAGTILVIAMRNLILEGNTTGAILSAVIGAIIGVGLYELEAFIIKRTRR